MAENATPKRFLQSLTLLLFTLTIGVAGFMLIEDYVFIDAVYMTIITMSTVGYSTIKDLSYEGKIFVVFLIIFTAGTFFYAISVLTTFIVEGEIQQVFKKIRVSKEVSRLSNHIIVCGLGRNGREAALELRAQKVPFVAIENDPEVIEDFRSHYPGSLVLEGDATLEEILVEANISTARGIITTLSEDAQNVFVTLTARELNHNVTIVARASYESTISKLRRAGANRVILPNILGGRKMAKIITKPALVEFVDMITGEGEFSYHLEVIHGEQIPNLMGKTLGELNIKNKTGVLVLGFKDDKGKMDLNPGAHTRLDPGDRMFILGTKDQLKAFSKEYMDGRSLIPKGD